MVCSFDDEVELKRTVHRCSTPSTPSKLSRHLVRLLFHPITTSIMSQSDRYPHKANVQRTEEGMATDRASKMILNASVHSRKYEDDLQNEIYFSAYSKTEVGAYWDKYMADTLLEYDSIVKETGKTFVEEKAQVRRIIKAAKERCLKLIDDTLKRQRDEWGDGVGPSAIVTRANTWESNHSGWSEPNERAGTPSSDV